MTDKPELKELSKAEEMLTKAADELDNLSKQIEEKNQIIKDLESKYEELGQEKAKIDKILADIEQEKHDQFLKSLISKEKSFGIDLGSDEERLEELRKLDNNGISVYEKMLSVIESKISDDNASRKTTVSNSSSEDDEKDDKKSKESEDLKKQLHELFKVKQ